MTAQPDRPEPKNDAKEADTGTAAEAESAAPAQAESRPSADDLDPSVLQDQADANRDKYLRAAAELENVRKRAARDVDNARKYALERFSGELLAVRDSLELGLEAAGQSDDPSAADDLRAGSQATLKLLAATMERFGVVELDPHGEPFDPQQHEAITTQPSADVEPGTVITVFQKGYSLNGRLLRPARVVVAAEPAAEPEKS